MTDVVIVSAVCTVVGKLGGSLAKIVAPEPSVAVTHEMLVRVKAASDQVSEVIMGQVLMAGLGRNPTRQAVVKVGLSGMVPGLTINRVCGSDLKAAMSAVDAIIAGDTEIAVAGGQESMFAAPHALLDSRDGFCMGDAKLIDSMIVNGLWDVHNQYHMDITAENVAREYGITCEAQDEFAVASQSRAEVTQKSGRFNDKIVLILIPQCKDDPIVFAQDEFVRHGVVLESMAGLKPAFGEAGTVTTADVSGLSDGAAAAVVMSATKARELDLTPLVTIRTYANAGLDPKVMGMGPVSTSKHCLSRIGWSVGDLNLVEVNEAFVVQAPVVRQQMSWNTSKINVNGGAAAIGYPIGASGRRILVTLLHGMQKRNAKKGLASLCIGGGMDVALAVRRP